MHILLRPIMQKFKFEGHKTSDIHMLRIYLILSYLYLSICILSFIIKEILLFNLDAGTVNLLSPCNVVNVLLSVQFTSIN